MKKLLSVVLCLLMIAVLLPLNLKTSSAEDETSGQCGADLYWSFFKSTGTLVITGSGHMDTWIYYAPPWQSIREKIKTICLPVGLLDIGDQAFCYCTELTEISIPGSVTSIGACAFAECAGLESVTIGYGVTSIGHDAFRGCTGLTSVTIPDSVTSIDANAFSNCTGFTEITIPDSVTSIGAYAFSRCTGLTSITIGSGIRELTGFSSCTSIKRITIPDSVTSIGDNAFSRCTGLTAVTIPDSVTSIGSSAFYECTELTDILIPDSVTSIRSYAFTRCFGLSEITIPNSVTEIGEGAFEGCNSIKEVVMGNHITCIQRNAFATGGTINSVYISDLGSWCNIDFEDKSSNPLRNTQSVYINGKKEIDIVIPSTVARVSDYSFIGCRSLRSITIPDSVTSIGDCAFSDCTGLQEATIPDSVKSIGANAFYNCTSLQEITIPDSVTSIGGGAFSGCTGLTDITIPDSVTSIGYEAFSKCTGLTEITIPGSIAMTEGRTFYYCTGLKSVTIRSGVTSISSSAFYYCTGLSEITIPDSVTTVYSGAFLQCNSLTDVYYSGSEEQREGITIKNNNDSLLNATWHYNSDGPDGKIVFNYGVLQEDENWALRWETAHVKHDDGSASDASLTIYMDGTDQTDSFKFMYDSETGDYEPWIAATGLDKETFTQLTVRGSSINPLQFVSYQFAGYTGLQQVSVSHVHGIMNNAFEGCSSLLLVQGLDEDLNFIGTAAFKNCTNLTTISDIEKATNLSRIASETFMNTSLSEFVFIDSIETIETRAFCNADLNVVTLGKTVQEIGEDAFANNPDILVYCYRNTVALQYAIDNGIPYQLLDSLQIYNGDETIELDKPFIEYIVQTGSTTYNPELSLLLMGLSRAAYDKTDIYKSLISLGFERDNIVTEHYNDEYSLAAYSIAKQEIPGKDGELLVLITIRGTSAPLEWIANINMGLITEIATGWHQGFEASTNDVYESLESFLGGIPTSNVTYVVTGHSLGAAVANQLSVKLFDAGVSSSNVYDYNFACPDVANGLGSRWNYLGEHNNMFNIGNASDLITYLPGFIGDAVGILLPLFTWGKYGRSVWFSNDWSSLGETQILTADVFASHDAKLYLDYMKQKQEWDSYKTIDEINTTILQEQFRTLLSAICCFCPVDVIVYDENENAVAGVIDNKAQYYDSAVGETLILINGDQKVICLPAQNTYKVSIIATDKGEFQYTVLQGDFLSKEFVSQKDYESVELQQDKAFISDVGGEITPDKVRLYVVNEDGEPIAEVHEDGTETPVTQTFEGQCGDDLYWSFDKETGTLTITGSGDMWDYEGGAMPWEDVTVEYVDSYGGALLRDDPTVSLIHYIVLPEGLTSIASGAFCGTLIESIEIPSTVKSILYMAFADCENLKSIAIPDGISKITWQCFSNCGQLESVTLPVSVTEVYEGAFWDCNAITDVYYQGTAEQRAEMTFGDDNEPLLNAEWHYQTEIIEGTVEWNAEDVEYRGSTPYVIANGKAQTPRFTVKNSADGSVIDPGFYDYEYRENTDAGTGYVIVTFKGDYSGTAQDWFKIYLPATTKTWVENVSDGIKVGWEPVEGAAGYVIYRRAWSTTTNGWTEFKRWNNTTETTYIDGKDEAHKVYAGTRYQYGVKAYFAKRTDPVSGALIGGNVGDNYNLGEVGPLKTTVRITTRKLVQVRPGKKEMTVKWEKSKNFTGYQIQIATDSAFKQNTQVIKIDNWETYWTTVRDLNSNTTYYVRIRSYQEFEGMTYFGEWSNVISCRVK